MILTPKLIDRYIDFYKFTDTLNFTEKNNCQVEPNAFINCRDKQIRSLHLQWTKNNELIKKLPDQIRFNKKHLSLFEPLGENLENLDLSFNIFECQFNFLKDLKHLRKLDLSFSNFKVGKPIFNAANNQLTHLDLSNCDLEIKDKTIFNDLKCLTYLDLSKIALKNVLPDLFKELNQLETLKMMGTSLPMSQNAFIHLEILKSCVLLALRYQTTAQTFWHR